MDSLPLAPLMYMFNSVVVFWYGFRSYASFKKSGNKYSKYIFYTGMGVGLAEFLYGIPWFFSLEPREYGFFYVLGILPLLLGSLFSVRIPLQAYGNKKVEYLVLFVATFAISLLFLSHLRAIPVAVIDERGIVYWNVDRFYAIWWSILLVVTTFLPAFYFFFARVTATVALFKKILFGLTYVLAGLGGILLVLFGGDPFWTSIFFIIQFLGFVSLASIFLVDSFLERRQNSETRAVV